MQTLDNFNFAGKKAFVRVDFNVPMLRVEKQKKYSKKWKLY